MPAFATRRCRTPSLLAAGGGGSALWPAQQQRGLRFALGAAPHGGGLLLSTTPGQQKQQQLASRPARRGRGSLQQRPGPAPDHPLAAFAVLSGSRLFGIRHDDSIRATFKQIDVDQKGHITEADLRQFAASKQLPVSYVRPFIDAVLQHQQARRPQQQQQGDGGGWSGDAYGSAEGEVSFAAFVSFVRSREAGLREAFRSFDLDGDGHISAQDLCTSLSRVAICSGSCSVLRTRHDVVTELLSRLNMQHGSGARLSFAEFRNYFLLLPEQSQLVEYWLSGPAAISCADMGGHFTVLERSGQRRGSPWGHLLAGAVAGGASRTATAPLETLRLAAMAGRLPPGTSLVAAAQQLVATSGVGGLWKGNGVNVIRSAPARAIDFFAFEKFKSWIGSDTYHQTFAAAGLAGTCSWALLYPLEVVRSRLTLDSSYSGIRHCVASMLAHEGPGALYRGLGPSLAAIAPEAAITYGLHDLLKRAYRRWHHGAEPDVVPSLCCGVVAAWSGQAVAFPLEVVSRRMQLAGSAAAAAAVPAVQAAGGAGAGAGSGAAPGMLSVLAGILKEGGPAALYRGLGAATLRIIPSAVVSFGAYELIQKLWLSHEAQQEGVRAARQSQARYQAVARVLDSSVQCSQLQQQMQAQGEVQPLTPEQQLAAAVACGSCVAGSGGRAAAPGEQEQPGAGAGGPCVPCGVGSGVTAGPGAAAASGSGSGATTARDGRDSAGPPQQAAPSACSPCGGSPQPGAADATQAPPVEGCPTAAAAGPAPCGSTR